MAALIRKTLTYVETTLIEGGKAAPRPLARRGEVLDDFRADHEIERRFIEAAQYVGVGGEDFEAAFRMRTPGLPNALLAQVHAHDLATARDKCAARCAVAAADIQHARAGLQRSGQSQHTRHEVLVHVRLGGVGKSKVFVLGGHFRRQRRTGRAIAPAIERSE